jgi:pyruvate/2-oxoglutarate dehydrogenase complex dihydrolipoamide dehydrogenase (E3) component
MDRYDLIVIGGGAAGLVTSAGAAGLGGKVALVERNRMGGECLWTGCVPSKALIAAARELSQVRGAARYGIDVSGVNVDFQRVMAHVHGAQQAIAPHDSPERFRGLGVDVVEGTARFVDANTVAVGDREMKARHIVIATGSRPAIPPIDGLMDVELLTNENVFELTALPASLTVIGGGAIGIELAQAFAILGTKVVVLENQPRLLRTEDEEIVDGLRQRLMSDGVQLHTGVAITSVVKSPIGVRVHTSAGTVESAALLVAAGRKANIEHLDLADAGVHYDQGRLSLDEYLRTNVKNIWAAGDVTGAPRFTHVADYQARLVLRNALFPGKSAASYDNVPWAIYTHPEIAHVGLTEAQARDRHGDAVRVFRKHFRDLDRAIADGQREGLLKIIADRKGRVIGAHVLGPHASTLLGELTLAIRKQVTLSELSGIIHAYPTYAESIKHMGDAFVRSGFSGLKQKVAKWIVSR